MDEIPKWWPVITFGLVIVVAVGDHRARLRTLGEKVKSLFDLWNEHMKK